MAHHNEVCDDLIQITKCAFEHNCVHRKPLIYQGHSISNNKVHHGRGEKYTIGNVLIRGVWERQTDAIIDIRFFGYQL